MLNTGVEDFMMQNFIDNPNEIFYSGAAMNNTKLLENLVNNRSIFASLLRISPEYIPMVPGHWLFKDILSYDYQLFVSIVFLLIGIPANVGHILVFLAFARYKTDIT